MQCVPATRGVVLCPRWIILTRRLGFVFRTLGIQAYDPFRVWALRRSVVRVSFGSIQVDLDTAEFR